MSIDGQSHFAEEPEDRASRPNPETAEALATSRDDACGLPPRLSDGDETDANEDLDGVFDDLSGADGEKDPIAAQSTEAGVEQGSGAVERQTEAIRLSREQRRKCREHARLTLEGVRSDEVRRQIGSEGKLDAGKAEQTGKAELCRVADNSGAWDVRRIKDRDLWNLIGLVSIAVNAIDVQALNEVVDGIIDDQDAVQNIQKLVKFSDDVRQYLGMPSEVEDPVTRSDSPGHLFLGGVILAGAVLLAAGVTVPVFIGAAAEAILTNEVAIAALVVAVAALIKAMDQS